MGIVTETVGQVPPAAEDDKASVVVGAAASVFAPFGQERAARRLVFNRVYTAVAAAVYGKDQSTADNIKKAMALYDAQNRAWPNRRPFEINDSPSDITLQGPVTFFRNISASLRHAFSSEARNTLGASLSNIFRRMSNATAVVWNPVSSAIGGALSTASSLLARLASTVIRPFRVDRTVDVPVGDRSGEDGADGAIALNQTLPRSSTPQASAVSPASVAPTAASASAAPGDAAPVAGEEEGFYVTALDKKVSADAAAAAEKHRLAVAAAMEKLAALPEYQALFKPAEAAEEAAAAKTAHQAKFASVLAQLPQSKTATSESDAEEGKEAGPGGP